MRSNKTQQTVCGIHLYQLLTEFPYGKMWRALSRRNDAVAEQTAFAVKLYSSYLEGRSFRDALQMFCRIAITLDLGAGGKAIVNTNWVIRCLADTWAMRAPYWSQRCLDQITEMINGCRQVDPNGWYAAKLHILHMTTNVVLGTRAYIESLRMPVTLGRDLKLLEQKLMPAGQLATVLAEQTAEHRIYGIKSSYHLDPLFCSNRQAWGIIDPSPLQELVGSKRGPTEQFIRRSLCVVCQVDPRRKPTLNTVAEFDEWGTLGGMQRFGIEDETGDFTWILSDTAELYAAGPGAPMRQLFAEAGAEETYELLRLSLMARVHGLVMPITAVRSLAHQSAPRRLGGLLPPSKQSQIEQRLDPTIYIPRLRIVDQPSGEISSALEQEVEQGTAETKAAAGRELRKHEVVWHLRQLPPGHTPSLQAQARAREVLGDHYVLPPGKTFVKRHNRGTIEVEAPAHRAKLR